MIPMRAAGAYERFLTDVQHVKHVKHVIKRIGKGRCSVFFRSVMGFFSSIMKNWEVVE